MKERYNKILHFPLLSELAMAGTQDYIAVAHLKSSRERKLELLVCCDICSHGATFGSSLTEEKAGGASSSPVSCSLSLARYR